MKRYLHIEESEIKETLQKITEQQARRGTFYNVTVKPYKGLYHPVEVAAGIKYYTVIIG